MGHDRDRNDERDPLIRIASRVVDGEAVDWEEEAAKSPRVAAEIRELHSIESIILLQRQIASHADGHDAQRPFDPDDPGPLAPGEDWGPLQVLDHVGRGSGGDVYRAFDPALGREVALKIWREDALYRTTGTEARKLRKIEHPSVLRVLGIARHGGLAGMWTDFLEGRTLEEILAERGPLAVEDACRIGIGISEALEAVHAGGMVHRDIKATNVMWLADGSIVLIDLGSAKELPGGVPVPSERIRGAPLGAAPEVLRGDAIGPAADVYSLGILLYRLVTGAYPIEARNLLELFEMVEARQVVPLIERRPGCEPAFAELVHRALAFEPAERPTMATIRAELTQTDRS